MKYMYSNNKESLRILQWNAKSILPRVTELSMNFEGFNIILISETWLTAKKQFIIRGFDTVRKDRIDRMGGGVAILISNGVKYKRITDIYECDSKIEACAVQIYTNGESLTFVSCYRPPNDDNILASEWKRFFSQFDDKVLFGGDFNGHNAIWGSTYTNSVGNDISEALDDLDLTILNDGTSTFHCAAYHTNSVIDLSIVHDSIALSFHWSVGKDPWGSDHFPIIIESNIKIASPDNIKRSPRLHRGNTDWNKFQNDLEKKLKLLSDYATMEVEVLYSTVVAVIEDALIGSSPQAKSRGRDQSTQSGICGPPCPWWTEECNKLVRLRKAALLKFQFTGLRKDFIEYKKRVAITRRELRGIKREKFQVFCESLRKESDPSLVWKTVKKFQSRFNRVESSHEYTPEKLDRVSVHIDELRTSWAIEQVSSFEGGAQDDFLDHPYSEEEMSVVINNLKVKSSPGLDNIDYKIIKNIPPMCRCVLLHIPLRK